MRINYPFLACLALVLLVVVYHVGMEALVSNRPPSVGRCVLGPLEDAVDLLELSFVHFERSFVQMPLPPLYMMCWSGCPPEVGGIITEFDSVLRVYDQRESRIGARHGPE